MLDFRFLTKNEVFGSEQLDILKKYGSKCAITDFAVLLGGYVPDLLGGDISDYPFVEENSKKERCSYWWLKSVFKCGRADNVNAYGDKKSCYVYSRIIGARPVTSFIPLFFNKGKRINGILEAEYGEYPQTIVPEEFAKTLEEEYLSGKMEQTEKKYTTDSVWYLRYSTPLQKRTHNEYIYNGRKYIRFVGDHICELRKLSDRRVIKKNEVYWVEVEPIKWLIDEKTGKALSKKILFSGVQFDIDRKDDVTFEESVIKQFMDEFFSNEIRNDVDIKIDEVEDNESIKIELLKFYNKNKFNDLFVELNSMNDEDNLSLFMDIILDSDTYYEMNSKLDLLKKTILTYDNGNKKEAFDLLKEINSDIHKERINGKKISYPTNCLNRIEKPKKIIDRMKSLYSRLDVNCDCDYLDSIHENACSLSDFISRKNSNDSCDKVKRRIFAKKSIN